MISKLKEDLANQVLAWIEGSGITLTAAAKIFGVAPPRMSNLKSRQLEKFSVDALLGMLECTGYSYNATTEKSGTLRILFSKD